MTVALDVTTRLKVPRALFVPFRMGHHFGVPFHRELQRRIVMEALGHVPRAQASGDIHRIPLTWAQARREGLALQGDSRLRPRL